VSRRLSLFRSDYFDIHYMGLLVRFDSGSRTSEESILKALTSVFKAQSAIYCIHNGGRSIKREPPVIAVNIGSKYLEKYITSYHQIDPSLKRSVNADACREVDLMRLSEWEGLGFYKDFLKPQGLYRSLVIYLRDEKRLLGHINLYKDHINGGFSSKDLFKARVLASIFSPFLRHTHFSQQSPSSERFLKWIIEYSPEAIVVLNAKLRPICWNKSYLDIGLALGWEADSSYLNENWPMLTPVIIKECMRIQRSMRDDEQGARFYEQRVITETLESRLEVDIVTLPEQQSADKESIPYYFVIIIKKVEKEDASVGRLIPNYWELTPKEKEIIQYICDGRTNKEISDILCISVHTVATHVVHIFSKTGTENRVSLMRELMNSVHSRQGRFLK
jgi:DNA-binding CsgD family transcriptional regulator